MDFSWKASPPSSFGLFVEYLISLFSFSKGSSLSEIFQGDVQGWDIGYYGHYPANGFQSASAGPEKVAGRDEAGYSCTEFL